MSTTFDVFPSVEQIPTFEELLTTATGHLNAYLRSNGIDKSVNLSVRLMAATKEYRELPTDLAAPCWWSEKQYAWFQVSGVPGGTDAYANIMAEEAHDLGRSTLAGIRGAKAEEFSRSICSALNVGKYWSFRRSAGQPAVINIAYGIIAASLAQLAKGFVHSEDSAWDSRLLPAWPEDFLQSYFRAGATEHEQEWVARCIAALPNDLRDVRHARNGDSPRS